VEVGAGYEHHVRSSILQMYGLKRMSSPWSLMKIEYKPGALVVHETHTLPTSEHDRVSA